MKRNLTPIASAVAIFMLSSAVHAQQTNVAPATPAAPAAPVTATPDDGAQQVVVTGIRASLQKSLEKKRDSDSHIEVLTAEDIGKLPDKNVADSLSHLPGVTTETSQGAEGGFGENDRVSMRGTSAGLTQTLINGHNIASGDWFVLGQYAGGDVGRSVSYTLLPSELVGEVDVYKTSQASLVEGGLTGSVDIKTRKPLDFQKQLTVEGSIGASHNSLAGNTDPQFNGVINWKNDANTFGLMVSGFDEVRHFERQGQETVGGFLQIAPGSKIALSNPDLSGAYYPSALGSALFEQKRERKGGTFDAQMKLTNDLTVDLNGFVARLDATNQNDNYMFWGKNIVQLGAGQAPMPGYQTTTIGGITTLTSAQWAPVAGTAYGVYDQIFRPDEGASSDYLDLDLSYRFSDHLKFKSSLGVSYGHGLTPVQNVLETNVMSQGGGYSYNGIGSAANVNFAGNNNLSQANSVFNWIFGDQNVDVVDSEKWGQIDGTYTLNEGVVNDIQFGIRESDHSRSSLQTLSQHPLGASTATLPVATGTYPSGFGSGLGGSPITQIWTNSAAQIAAYDAQYASVYQADGQGRSYWQHDFSLQEKSQAAYVQANMSGDRWSANAGLRFVRTDENVIENIGVLPTTPGANTASAFGPYLPTLVANTYNDVLPSANLRLDVTKDLVARFAVSTTMTRPDYTALAGSTSLNSPTNPAEPGTGTGSNPNLKPVKSNNFDTSLEWYFAPHSLLAASVFYMDLTSYVGFSTTNITYTSYTSNYPNGAAINYSITAPVNTTGKVEGVEFSYESPLPVYTNFGVQANATFVNAADTGSDLSTCLCDGHLVGTSKQSGTLGGYYEDDRFNARISVNYRSSSYLGLSDGTPFYDAGGTTVSASAGYKINDHLVISLDGQNLNNPTLRYYGFNESQMRAVYKNGETYFITLRGKM
jgi:iron complex outermembrane receptor protein